ncbi:MULTISPECIES: hypothetical protein [unclassified Streptomyces]|uniref:hypothetical protein n=1 Tax=unclassified Streptomyces TaxID=2593676 RepID=UPI003693C05E
MLAEVFTSLDTPQLHQQLRKIDRKGGAFRSAPEGLSEWLYRSRERRGYGWVTLPGLTTPGNGRANPNSTPNNLPAGVEYVSGSLFSISSGIAVVVMEFTYAEEFSRSFGRLLNGRYTTEKRRLHGRRSGWSIVDVARQKEVAARKWREARHKEAKEWLNLHFNGFFSRDSKIGLPAVEILYTRGFDAWSHEGQGGLGRRLSALQLDSRFHSYWVSSTDPAVRVRHDEHGDAEGFKFESLKVAINRDAFSPNPDELEERFEMLSYALEEMTAKWALNRLVARSGERFNRTRNNITKALRGGSFRGIIRLRDDFLRNGMEANLAVREVVEVTTEQRVWSGDLPEFLETTPPGFSRQPVPLEQLWRDWQSVEADRISKVEQEFRDISSNAAALTNAAYNARLQGRVFWITIASLAVALVALWVSYASLQKG